MNIEELELLSDFKYRNYVVVIDKVLKNFEYFSEWVDLILVFGKFNKVCFFLFIIYLVKGVKIINLFMFVYIRLGKFWRKDYKM